MKGKGYRSSSVKAIWIVIAHLAAVAAAVCAAMFVMIYQTGIRLDDRGKSYTESEAFEKQVSNRGSDILVSLAAQDDINYLKNAGSSAVIDLAEKLNAENYTAESYAKLTAALAAAKEVCDAENATVEEISAQISAISDAIKGLESADKAANEDLKKQLEQEEEKG